MPEITRPLAEWKEKLTPEQYHVMFEGGTEAPFVGEYVHTDAKGTFTCAACGTALFSSEAKFESGTGWPSFDQPANRENVELREDISMGTKRTEVRCKNCGAHLGHVFNDGPQETTGQRFCINSCALKLMPVFLLAFMLVGAGCSNAGQKDSSANPSTAQDTSTATTTSTASNAANAANATTSATDAADGTTTAPKTGKKIPAPTKQNATAIVTILRGVFSPQVISAKAGDTILWINKDTVSHTTHSDGSLIWDTGAILPGKSASHRFMSPGTYVYSDGNTGIKGTVIIH